MNVGQLPISVGPLHHELVHNVLLIAFVDRSVGYFELPGRESGMGS